MLAVVAVAAVAAAACPGRGGRGSGSADETSCAGRERALAGQADARRRDGDLGRAEELLRQARQACPTQDVLLAHARVLGELGLVDRALQVYALVQADTAAEVAALRALPPPRRDASDADRAAAAELHREGIALRFAGNFDAALNRLRRSYAVYPHPLTVVQIGQVHKAAGREREHRVANARALALAEDRAGVRAELRIHQGHLQEVRALAVTGDGRLMVSGGGDRSVILWDLTSGRALRRKVGFMTIHDLVLSADGGALYVGHDHGVDRIDMATFERRWGMVHLGTESLAAGARHVATGDDKGVVKVWDAASGLLVRDHKANDLVYALAISPDGSRLAAGTRSGELRVWNLVDGSDVARWLTSGTCHALAWSPDGSLAAGVSGGVQLWTANGARLGWLDQGSDVVGLAFDVTGARLAAGDRSGGARVWDIGRGTVITEVRGHDKWVDAVALRPGTDQLITGGWDHRIEIWDAATGARVRTLAEHGAAQAAVAFAPDGRRLASGGADHVVRLWDLGAATSLRRLAGHGDDITQLVYSRGGLLASGSADRTIRLWRDGATEPVAVLDGHPSWVQGLDVDARSERMVSSSGAELLVWRGDKLVQRVRGHDPETYGVAFSPDGTRVAYGGEDYTQADVQVRDLESGVVTDFAGGDGQILSVAFSPDGRQLAAGGRQLLLWDAVAGGAPRVTMPVSEPGNPVFGLRWDHRGQRLAASSLGAVVVFGADGSELYRLAAHDSWVRAVDFSPDDHLLATASDDRTVKLWAAATGELLATLFADGDRWLVWAPDGRLDASAEEVAAELIYWQVGDDLQLPAFVGWQRNHTPGLLGAQLSGR